MKNYLGECNSKVTRQNGERSEILVSNPEMSPDNFLLFDLRRNIQGCS